MATDAVVAETINGLVGAVVAFGAWVMDSAPGAMEWMSEKARYAWALAAASVRVALRKVVRPRVFSIQKVVALNETDGRDALVTSEFESAEWEESVRVATRWFRDALRAEVRYVFHGKKFRLVLRPGDTCEFGEDNVPVRHRGGPKGVMAAELVGHEATVDITRRIHKYQGPLKDFHAGMGLRVGITDMFPLDDIGDLTDQFHTLRIVDAHARVLNLPIDCPDLAKALAQCGKDD